MLKNSELSPVGLGASFRSDAMHLCYARQSGDRTFERRLDLLVRCIGPSRRPQAMGLCFNNLPGLEAKKL